MAGDAEFRLDPEDIGVLKAMVAAGTLYPEEDYRGAVEVLCTDVPATLTSITAIFCTYMSLLVEVADALGGDPGELLSQVGERIALYESFGRDAVL